MRIFRLYQFSDGHVSVITRGLTEAQAMSYAAQSPSFKRGATIFPVNHCSINAAKLYSQNHNEGWLYRAPLWLFKQEAKLAVEMGVEKILSGLCLTTDEEVLLFNGVR
jgi:hypothetical protein